MRTGSGITLAELTTLRVGGPAAAYAEAASESELVTVVRDGDRDGPLPTLVLGGGSNLLVGDDGYAGQVVGVRTRGVEARVDDCAGVWLEVAAGEPWDGLVARCTEQGWVGVEALAGIPGLVGATPIQNVGAYGQQVADVVARVRTFDRVTARQRTFAAAECGFGYRTSRFKTEPGRFLVLSVVLQLRRSALSEPIHYVELARAVGVEVGDRAPLAVVRDAVLELRRRKGMVLDPADHDTWSAGSFFTNPLLDPAAAAGLPADAPRFEQPDGRVKTSAAWLIEQAGFGRGFALPAAPGAAVSGKHTLALTNRGSATAADLLLLAQTIRARVAARFAVVLDPEPALVGCVLPATSSR